MSTDPTPGFSGCSDKGWEDAARLLVARVSPALPASSVLSVEKLAVVVEDGNIVSFRLDMKLAPVAPAQPRRPARILVVDDLPSIQELARSILEGAGHEVHVTSDGADAVALVRANEYDLVLMDIHMPMMDGLAAAREIRALTGPVRHVPILSMTADALPDQLRGFEEAGMNDHILKPLRRDELLSRVGRWLQRRFAARILVADDIEMIRELARSLLEPAGHSVDAVPDGAQAVDAVQARAYDVVLMDIQMPVMDGVEATRRIRALASSARDIPIIAMTTNLAPDQARIYEAVGMNAVIGKPLDRRELLGKVSACLDTGSYGRHFDISGALPPVLFDRNTFEEFKETVGPKRAVAWLLRFKDELEVTLRDAALAGREELARDVHRLIAQAGMLGFPELCRLLAELEEACSTGGDIGALIDSAAKQSKRAFTAIDEMAQAHRSE